MKRFLPLLLCLSLTIFSVARALKPAHIWGPDPKSMQKSSMQQRGDAKTLFDHETTEEVVSDDDESTEGTSDEGEDLNESDDADFAGSQDAEGNDGGTDDGGDNGGDEGE